MASCFLRIVVVLGFYLLGQKLGFWMKVTEYIYIYIYIYIVVSSSSFFSFTRSSLCVCRATKSRTPTCFVDLRADNEK